MKLSEVQENLSLQTVVAGLSQRLGQLERVGGNSRTYVVDGARAAAYVIPGTMVGLGVAWKGSRVSSIYLWRVFDVSRSPDFAVDIPAGIDFRSIVDPLIRLLRRPRLGKIVIGLNEAQDDQSDTDFDNLLQLAKAKEVSRLASAGKIVLFGRKPDGTLFEIPGLDAYAAQIERVIGLQQQREGASGMKEQYEELAERVRLVAGKQGDFIRSLLITGAPSSGKSFNVMKVIQDELGLKEGDDYVLKKGRISPTALFRTLIEQVDGMVIFDDCDSVVKDKDARNMLKGALDTNPIREVSNDSQRVLNTGAMPVEERVKLVHAASRILRGVPKAGDIDLFEPYMKELPEGPEVDSDYIKQYGLEPDDVAALKKHLADHSKERTLAVQQFLTTRPPNKIDFAGRIIFISNMEQDEWEPAIIERAFTMNMSFTSKEMLDYIYPIKDKLGGELSSQERTEVLDYIRDLYNAGKIKQPINFRFVQKAFDLRKTSIWKRMIAAMG